jgi:hypothetical protein
MLTPGFPSEVALQQVEIVLSASSTGLSSTRIYFGCDR